VLSESGRHGHERGAETVRKHLQVIELMWMWAYENDDEWENLVPRPRRLKLTRTPPPLTVAPTWDEMDACIEACNAWHRQLALLLRFTGLRVQQAMDLRWSDVDLDRATLSVRGELGKSRQERSGRTIPISMHLVELLRSWERRDEYIVPCERQAGPRAREARGRDMARAWKRAGVRPQARKQPHHAFRKGFVSELKRAGADDEAVEFLVGHSLGLRGVYTDPDALPLRAAVALIPHVGCTFETGASA
jgi:integrase